jgi:hypothetical protein
LNQEAEFALSNHEIQSEGRKWEPYFPNESRGTNEDRSTQNDQKREYHNPSGSRRKNHPKIKTAKARARIIKTRIIFTSYYPYESCGGDTSSVYELLFE